MADLSIFDQDNFTVENLTLAINDLEDVKPTRLQQLGWFQESGISTTYADIERGSQGLQLVTNKDRGAPGQPVQDTARKTIPVKALHLPQTGSVMADEVQNVRAFGSQNELETVQSRVNEKLSMMRDNLDSTIEYHRINALQGKVLDSDGTTVLHDLLTTFNMTRQEHSLKLTDTGSKLRAQVLKAKKKSTDALKGKTVSGFHALLSYGLFEKYLENDDFLKSWERYNQGEMLRNDLMMDGFVYGGVTFELYDYSLGDKAYIPDGEGLLVPLGVRNFCLTKFAPANYMETVNTQGLPYYAKQMAMDYDKGRKFESQSNPINLCTQPDAVIKLLA
ncbi:MAG: major capsid protein [Cognaticolwellia aestuarii]